MLKIKKIFKYSKIFPTGCPNPIARPLRTRKSPSRTMWSLLLQTHEEGIPPRRPRRRPEFQRRDPVPTMVMAPTGFEPVFEQGHLELSARNPQARPLRSEG